MHINKVYTELNIYTHSHIIEYLQRCDSEYLKRCGYYSC